MSDEMVPVTGAAGFNAAAPAPPSIAGSAARIAEALGWLPRHANRRIVRRDIARHIASRPA